MEFVNVEKQTLFFQPVSIKTGQDGKFWFSVKDVYSLLIPKKYYYKKVKRKLKSIVERIGIFTESNGKLYIDFKTVFILVLESQKYSKIFQYWMLDKILLQQNSCSLTTDIPVYESIKEPTYVCMDRNQNN